MKLVYLVVAGLLALGVSHRAADIWPQLSVEDSDVTSYLWPDDVENDTPRLSFMRKLLRVIHASQSPSLQQCKSRKLLVLQMKSTSFEGTGSLMKQIMLGIAIAMHSNRTLVWGLGLPYIFDHTQEVWSGSDNRNVQVGDHSFDCMAADPAGGAHSCFFHPMTTCSLADAQPMDIMQYSLNPHNDSARLMVGEVSRRGVALYHPPAGLFDYILDHQDEGPLAGGLRVTREDLKGAENHIWVSTIAAYLFRLKEPVQQSFEAKHRSRFQQRPVWGLHVRHGDLKALPNLYRYKTIFEFEEYFAVARDLSHVRGESPAQLFLSSDSPEVDDIQNIYRKFSATNQVAPPSASPAVDEDGDAKVVDYSDVYYDEDIDVPTKNGRVLASASSSSSSSSSASSSAGGKSKSSSTKTASKKDSRSASNSKSKDVSGLSMKVPMYKPEYLYWYSTNATGAAAPTVFVVGNDERYRTNHGSHTVAANGGCLKDDNFETKGMKCSLEFDMIVEYQNDPAHHAVPRSKRIFRVYAESVEDLYLLSLSDAFIAQGSSYFSTLASYLVWARTGCADVLNTVKFLDQTHIEAGIVPTAHLHGMNLLNSTYGYDPALVADAGQARWKVHTEQFIPAVKKFAGSSRISLDMDPFDKSNRMRMVDMLPQMPAKIFYHESESWLAQVYKPVWPGSCPGRIRKGQDLEAYVTAAVNHGVEMHETPQVGQAAQCWTDGKRAILSHLSKLRKKRKSNRAYIESRGGEVEEEEEESVLEKFLVESLEIVTGNLNSIRILAYSDMVINEHKNSAEYFAADKRSGVAIPPGFLKGDQSKNQRGELLLPAAPDLSRIDASAIKDWAHAVDKLNLAEAIDILEDVNELIEVLGKHLEVLEARKKELLAARETAAKKKKSKKRKSE